MPNATDPNLNRWPGTGPFRRAARWDGIIPTGWHGRPSPDDTRQMRAYINNYRTATTPFDVVFQGRAHEVPVEEGGTHVADSAAAGVTWWLEQVWPDVALTEARSIIDQGPPSLIDDAEPSALDVWDSARFSSSFQTLGFSRFQV